MNGSAGDAFTSAASAESAEAISNAASDHFGILNRPDFAAGIAAFREHYGQEVRCKIPEGYTFLGLDKATLTGNAGAGQQQQPYKARSSQTNRAHGSIGVSPAHSSSSQASHTQHASKESSLSGFKGSRPPPLTVAAAAASTVAAGAEAETTVPISNASATSIAAATVAHSGQREKESTLDHLLSFMKNSPTTAPNTARTTTSLEQSLPSASANTSTLLLKKTTVLSQAQSRLEALDVQLPLHLTIELPSIERLIKLRSGADKLKARAEKNRQERQERQEKLERLERLEKLERQAAAAASVPASVTAREAKPSSKGGEPDISSYSTAEHVDGHSKGGASARGASGNPGKRPASSFVFQIRVPKRARRTVIEAIALVQPSKRQALSDAVSKSTAAEAHVPELDATNLQSNKRARKSAVPAEPRASRTRDRSESLSSSARSRSVSPAPRSPSISTSDRHPANGTTASASSSRAKAKVAHAGSRVAPRSPRASRSRSSTRSSTRSTSLQRSRQQPVATPVSVPVSQHQLQLQQPIAPILAASSFSKLVSSVSPAEIESLRRQSARLEESMRSFKHIGDAERASGGKLALEMVYYLESLSCCMEDFWIQRVFTPLADTHKNWVTMLNICTYLYKKCESRDLSVLQGCTATITACVYYQLASVAFDLARGMKDLDEIRKTIGDASRYLGEMESFEQDSRQLLSAHNIAWQLPQMWRRCQESSMRLGPFELRSNPYTKKWPSVAYPVGATSNPLDIANMVRQAGREWLDRAGLSLRMPKN
ncbi:hypothetical protein LPJ75_001123 [Coemansia sp. RSA 2598]|nr:hypothetical protein LPJ75_001123 [Coemansia sp. RSA 2598]